MNFNMTNISEIITSETFLSWFGAGISVIGTLITIYYAYKTKSIKDEIQSERKKISLRSTMDELKKVTPLILKLQKQNKGSANKQIIYDIKIHIDFCISNLKRDHTDENSFRENLQKSQALMHKFNSTNNIEEINICQTLIQDIISDIKSLLDKEGKI